METQKVHKILNLMTIERLKERVKGLNNYKEQLPENIQSYFQTQLETINHEIRTIKL